MFRKILTALFGVFIVGAASAGPVVNVEYIHQKIAQVWGIDIPYNPDIENVKNAANMKYLLTAVDAANRQLNKVRTSDYSSGEFATVVAVDTVAADMAVNDLVRPIQYHFTATTTETSEFSFKISAAGTFYIDWGDGTIEKIVRASAGTEDLYSHTYDVADVYNVGIGGRATGYNGNAAISFAKNTNLAGISGSLGRVFRTTEKNAQPVFSELFSGCTNMVGEIPENLFAGISGAPASYMFYQTFASCTGLSGQIPENLFAGITTTEPAAEGMFNRTFAYLNKLTGPSARINGEYLYDIWPDAVTGTSTQYTYFNCTGLSDYEQIPALWK